MIEKMMEVESTVQVYIPHRMNQCLTYDLANVTCVETLLRMCNVECTITEKCNVQFMSSTGYVPLIRYGKFVLNDYKSIVEFFSDRLVLQSNDADDRTRTETDCAAYSETTMFCMMKRLEDLEKWVCWLDKCTYYNETKPKYSSVYPFPLNHVIAAREHQKVKAYLREKELREGLPPEEVVARITTLLNVFSMYLSENMFLIGRKPKAIDAMLFGHLQVLIHYQEDDTSAVFQEVARYITNNGKLMAFLETVHRYIGRTAVLQMN